MVNIVAIACVHFKGENSFAEHQALITPSQEQLVTEYLLIFSRIESRWSKPQVEVDREASGVSLLLEWATRQAHGEAEWNLNLHLVQPPAPVASWRQKTQRVLSQSQLTPCHLHPDPNSTFKSASINGNLPPFQRFLRERRCEMPTLAPTLPPLGNPQRKVTTGESSMEKGLFLNLAFFFLLVENQKFITVGPQGQP